MKVDAAEAIHVGVRREEAPLVIVEMPLRRHVIIGAARLLHPRVGHVGGVEEVGAAEVDEAHRPRAVKRVLVHSMVAAVGAASAHEHIPRLDIQVGDSLTVAEGESLCELQTNRTRVRLGEPAVGRFVDEALQLLLAPSTSSRTRRERLG